jgi:cell wall-associated NlpC family hydrolase
MPHETALRQGDGGERARALQAATNRRLRARRLANHVCDEDGEIGPATMAAVQKAAWILGALRGTLAKIDGGEIPLGVERMIRNPGRRNDDQAQRGKKRLAHMVAERERREKEAGAARKRVVSEARKAAANYRANPGAYHYLAGGRANTEYLRPTPRDWRSDCSQFAAAVYKGAGLPSPATVGHEWASTFSMVGKGTLTTKPQAGDLGFYGTRGAPHHVEIYCGVPGQEFIGHGSPPIDSVTPGRPDFYLTYDFLD